MKINKANNYIYPISKAYCDFENDLTEDFVEKDK